MNVKHTLHTLFKSAVEKVAPPLSKSQFEEKRVLTPEEFVAAGDYLVHACPTWSWEGGDPKKRKSYLPADRQFLVTRNGAGTPSISENSVPLYSGRSPVTQMSTKQQQQPHKWPASGPVKYLTYA
ncbi:hypothetical protein Vretifemale_7442 [Volvox reticuliferus]|nr:hypothetical protein Vretifemale_7442 [Volvox reticuliferus]